MKAAQEVYYYQFFYGFFQAIISDRSVAASSPCLSVASLDAIPLDDATNFSIVRCSYKTVYCNIFLGPVLPRRHPRLPRSSALFNFHLVTVNYAVYIWYWSSTYTCPALEYGRYIEFVKYILYTYSVLAASFLLAFHVLFGPTITFSYTGIF